MLVRSTDTMGIFEDFYNEMFSTPSNIFSNRPPSDTGLFPGDIWTKIEYDFPELANIDTFDTIDMPKEEEDTSIPNLDECQIRNHDCMWGGHCASTEHPSDEPRMYMHSAMINLPPGTLRAPVLEVKQENKPAVSCQQSLLKSNVRAAALNTWGPMMTSVVHTPQTPPMSDDEETKCKPRKMLQLLNQTISECDTDEEEDSDLREYRGDYMKDAEDDDEDLEINVTDTQLPQMKETIEQNMRTCQYAAENDHSYHKDKNASMLMPNLGIDTPSDSEEEEIDVVSVSAADKSSIANRICTLPTNPSIRDRQQIQRRMATAITNNKINGIKTILPIRKTSIDNSRVKKKPQESRIVKRTRQYRTPYKRRSAMGNSSDSDIEPSEKRSLHNNMERQRRIDLRNAFEDLRLLVPEVNTKEKAAKVVILREASKYCYQLGNTSMEYTNELNELRKEQEQLRRTVSQLRRSVAATLRMRKPNCY